ncbi:MAG: peptide transporter ATP-binding protein [Hyphomicrobiales bacterium]|nr:peptide transporter ATP-binding protein [Hyphomicrobiales bacterium]
MGRKSVIQANSPSNADTGKGQVSDTPSLDRGQIRPEPALAQKLLEVRDLKTKFYTVDGVVNALNGISYSVDKGECLAIVGESGSGKTVGVLSILRLIQSPPGRIVGGSIFFKGIDLLTLDDRALREIRGGAIAVIFQDPMTSLNPVMRISAQITENIMAHERLTHVQARAKAVDLLAMVGIPTPAKRLNDYPHQFSGGMRQRVMIAMALSCSPQLIIADEPTTALDVTVQAQIVELVKKLQAELGTAVIWISHDLGVVARLADRVAVMYAGHIVETAPVDELYARPAHPYTIGLLNSLPRLDARTKTKLQAIGGLPPNLLGDLRGCPFAPRCRFATNRCREENPTLAEVAPGHAVACWHDELTRAQA